MNRLTIQRPDDWHVHLRDTEALKAVAPFTKAGFMSADLDRIQRAVERVPWVDHARVQRRFPNSLHVIAPGGHVSYNSCVDRVKQQFLATASVKGLDASCIVNEKLPPFALPSKT